MAARAEAWRTPGASTAPREKPQRVAVTVEMMVA